jgi:carboxylesterase
MNPIQDKAKPFFFQGNRTGCLLTHGFTGTPYEMRELGEYLAGRGYTVLGPRLFGHGTQVEDMARSRWWDWYNSALDGYLMLKGTCDRIFLIGLSMGGVISLLMGAQEPVDGVCALATPYITPNRLAITLHPFIPALSKFWKYAGKGGSGWVDKEAERTHSAYGRNPVRSGAEIHTLIDEMRLQLPNLTCPLLLIYSSGDGAIPIEHSELIYRDVSSSDKEIHIIDRSGHNITRDAQRASVFVDIADFIHRLSTRS